MKLRTGFIPAVSLSLSAMLHMPCFLTCECPSIQLLRQLANSLLSAQGAAQAFEDAAVLGALFSEIIDISQIPKALSIYETLRKPRAMEVRKRTLAQKIMYGMHDGPHQEAHDRQLALTAPMEGMQKWLWGSDVVAQANEMSKTMN